MFIPILGTDFILNNKIYTALQNLPVRVRKLFVTRNTALFINKFYPSHLGGLQSSGIHYSSQILNLHI